MFVPCCLCLQIPICRLSRLPFSGIFKGGGLEPGERHSRDTRDDGTVTLCTLRAATVLSRDCLPQIWSSFNSKVMSHSRDGPGVTAPLRTNIVPLTGVWNPPPSIPPPLKKSPTFHLSTFSSPSLNAVSHWKRNPLSLSFASDASHPSCISCGFPFLQ